MREKKCFKERIKQSFLGYFFAFVVMLGGVFGITNTLLATDVYAEPDTTEVTDDNNTDDNKTEDKKDDDKKDEEKALTFCYSPASLDLGFHSPLRHP